MSTPTTPSFPIPAPPPTPQVIDDLPCRTCGYNLRTLATDAVCPECATPIAASLGGELLRYADPNWLSSIDTGCQWVYVGMFTAFFAWFVRVKLIETFFPPIAAALIMAGTWQLTAPDPSCIGENRYGRLRNWSRGLGVVLFPIYLVTSFPNHLLSNLIFLFRGVQSAALFAWGIILIGYLMGMATRLPKSQIAQSIRYRMFLFAGSAIFVLAGWISRYVFGSFLIWKGQLIPMASMFNLLFIIQAVNIFHSYVKEEIAAAARPTRPTAWRTAGAFIYWIKQLFRSNNGNNN
jgi:hypothetical protein